MRPLFVLGLFLTGCTVRETPYTYVDQKEMAGRPGLFTGRPGAIVLYRDQGPPLLSPE